MEKASRRRKISRWLNCGSYVCQADEVGEQYLEDVEGGSATVYTWQWDNRLLCVLNNLKVGLCSDQQSAKMISINKTFVGTV